MNNIYRVIEIIDKYSIIVNYGHLDGATKNNKIRVIARGPEIVDSETGDLLGTLDAIKAELTIETVYEKFSICKNIEITKQNVLINPISLFENTTKIVKEINIDIASETLKKLPDDLIIRVGDPVEVV